MAKQKYGRIHRLLKILTLIQGEAGWNPAKLAAECEIGLRTVYRDLKMLEGAGIPIHFDPETEGYRLRADFFMPPVNLTLDEALATVVLADQVGKHEQIPMLKAAEKVAAKVRARLPQGIRDQIGHIDQHVQLALARAMGPESIRDVYDRVQAAIVNKRALICRYESLEARDDDAEEVFTFKPYALYFGERAWYAIGRHSGRNALRCLKLNRFSQIDLTNKPYGIPDDFSVDDFFGQAWRMIRGAKRYHVQIEVDSAFAENVADVQWHPTQTIEYEDDGSIVLNCTVDGLDEIVWWVLARGPHVKVRSPKALITKVRKLLDRAQKRYED